MVLSNDCPQKLYQNTSPLIDPPTGYLPNWSVKQPQYGETQRFKLHATVVSSIISTLQFLCHVHVRLVMLSPNKVPKISQTVISFPCLQFHRQVLKRIGVLKQNATLNT